MRSAKTINRARRLRRGQTEAEKKLWALLRDRRFGDIKFRRQHPAGPYVADFACVAAHLVIEVDGPSHGAPEQAAFDAERTAYLERAGWRVVRIANPDAFQNLEGVALTIEQALQLPSPPRGGEGGPGLDPGSDEGARPRSRVTSPQRTF